jgi:O-antigen/teichoic acid export membrane protein
MRDALRRYRRYPLFSTPEALLNIAGVQIPVLIIAAKAGPEAGHLLLGLQLMAAPMALLGSSISQVYVARAPQAFREGRLYPFTKAIMKRLALTGIPPLLAVAVLAPLLVPYVFGEQWTRSGVIIAWMAPWIAMQLIASPVSMVMMVTNRQAQLLLVRIVTLALRVGVVVLSITVMNSGYLVELFAIANALVYAIMAWLFINAARSSPGLEEKTVET